MNFFTYIGVTEDEFVEKYLNGGLVTQSEHKQFPLLLFTYSRKCVHDNVWDSVTSKCRGIVINRETDEIVARPFEKFHNYGSTIIIPGQENPEQMGFPPHVIEKVDGFMCTLYTWEGQSYIASKGSFHSVHAKWATAEYNKQAEHLWPAGVTPVFEGLCRDLRIVVDYGDRTGLVLLGLVNNETGEELEPEVLAQWARINGMESARVFDKTLLDALKDTLVANSGTEEGYVLTWYKPDAPPYRLKVKFIEYLRLHRMVTGVSPKRIWEVLSTPAFRAELDEYLSNSTPWFNKFVSKWIRVLRAEYDRLETGAKDWYSVTEFLIEDYKKQNGPYPNMGAERKVWAKEFLREENKEFAPILFAMLDNKDVSTIVWKRVKELTTNGHPMVDIHSL
jgi:RNA ligase